MAIDSRAATMANSPPMPSVATKFGLLLLLQSMCCSLAAAAAPAFRVSCEANLSILTMNPRRIGETRKNSRGGLAAIYLNAKQRKEYEVGVRDGELVFAESGFQLTGVAEARYYSFVMAPNGTIYFGPFSSGPRRFYHSTFLAGGDVAGAGEAHSRGLNLYLNLGSGHYLPKLKHVEQVARRLVAMGFPSHRIFLVNAIEGFERGRRADLLFFKRSNFYRKFIKSGANERQALWDEFVGLDVKLVTEFVAEQPSLVSELQSALLRNKEQITLPKMEEYLAFLWTAAREFPLQNLELLAHVAYELKPSQYQKLIRLYLGRIPSDLDEQSEALLRQPKILSMFRTSIDNQLNSTPISIWLYLRNFLDRLSDAQARTFLDDRLEAVKRGYRRALRGEYDDHFKDQVRAQLGRLQTL